MKRQTSSRPRPKLDPERWHQLKDILADALEQTSPAARTALVESRCANDAALLAEAESLVNEAEALLREPTDSLEDCAEHATVNLWQEDAPPDGQRIGAYVVTRELGRGGMGAVYLAARADGQFEKEVAIKVLKRGTDTEEVLRRFASERHILARLDHPNIARLLDAGTTNDGLPYFVMEYVAGAPVTRFAREHQLSIEERLGVFLKICAAVEVAHQNHVIHRDLKPSNILVNSEGEPKLLDFGIAKLLTEGGDAVELTAAGDQRLTPICASPEQTDGRPVTEASDVYALGALLYELLTGNKPHKFSSPHPPREEIVRVIREEQPALPSVTVSERETARLLRGDLDAIVSFAMRKEPEMRYPKVAALAADVRRYLAHEPVEARKGSTAYRARLLAHSRTTRRIAMAGGLLLVALAAFLFWSQTQRKMPAPVTVPNESSAPDNRKSIAVLPFDNFGDENPSYFADGVQDNILTDLGKVGGLKVVSRNAVAAYRGKEKNARAIGRELGVGNVLVGSVQRSGDRVRINAQLVDTGSDTQLWAEHYDRKVEDIFALQSELAQTIVAQLQTTLSTGEKAAIWKQPTQDLQAYDLYLKARAALNNSRGPDPAQSWNEAMDLAKAAIQRDPNFTLAYCLLNEVQLLTYRYGDDHTPERLAEARAAAETALRLDPKLEEAQLALVRYYYNGIRDYHRTEQELSNFPTSAPHTVEYYTLASLVERRLAKWEESIRDGRKAIELDPQNAELVVNLCQTLSGLRRYAEVRQLLNEAFARLHGKAPVRLWLVKEEVAVATGDLEGARAALDQAQASGETMDLDSARLWISFLQRDYAGVKEHVAKASDQVRDSSNSWMMLGAVADAEGNVAEARRVYAEAMRKSEASMTHRPDDAELLGELAVGKAMLGMKDEALRLARRAVELVPPGADALVAPKCVMRLAEICMRVGERDGAFEALGQSVKTPFGVTEADLKLDPIWDPLRNDPRFDRLIEEAHVSF